MPGLLRWYLGSFSYPRPFVLQLGAPILLNVAAARGDVEIVRCLLADRRVDPNWDSAEDGSDALQESAFGNHTEVVSLLLDDPRVDANSCNNVSSCARPACPCSRHLRLPPPPQDGDTPLHLGSYAGHVDTVKRLLACPRTNPNVVCTAKWSPLHAAAHSGHTAVAQLLLSDPRVTVDLVDDTGRTALHRAAYQGHAAVVELLLSDARIDVNTRDHMGCTALHDAASSGSSAVLGLLLAQPGVLYTASLKEWTPLHEAAAAGNDAAVHIFLADPRVGLPSVAARDGKTPLLAAAAAGHVPVVRTLLSDPRVDASVGCAGSDETPLHAAAAAGHEAVVDALLSDPAVNVNCALAATGHTPLMLAAWKGRVGVVRRLLADPRVNELAKDKVSSEGRAAVGAAAYESFPPLAARLHRTGPGARVAGEVIRRGRRPAPGDAFPGWEGRGRGRRRLCCLCRLLACGPLRLVTLGAAAALDTRLQGALGPALSGRQARIACRGWCCQPRRSGCCCTGARSTCAAARADSLAQD